MVPFTYTSLKQKARKKPNGHCKTPDKPLQNKQHKTTAQKASF